jgi:pimeloyl-ACP methyl ester carboxylesterase
VLFGGYALGRNRRGDAAEREIARTYQTVMRHGWGDEHSAFMRMFSAVYLPNGTREQIRWFAELQRKATSADNAVRLRRACDDIDVTELLGQVHVPTLVVHARHDTVAPYEQGRALAAGIPGATFVTLDSENHVLLPDEPAWAALMREIEAFLAG